MERMCAEPSARLNCAARTGPLELDCGVFGRLLETNWVRHVPRLTQLAVRRSGRPCTRRCAPAGHHRWWSPRVGPTKRQPTGSVSHVPVAPTAEVEGRGRVPSAECRGRGRGAGARALDQAWLLLARPLDPRSIDASIDRTNVAHRTNRRGPHRTLAECPPNHRAVSRVLESSGRTSTRWTRARRSGRGVRRTARRLSADSNPALGIVAECEC